MESEHDTCGDRDSDTRLSMSADEVIIDPKTSTLLELREPWRSERNQRQATYLSVGLTDTTG